MFSNLSTIILYLWAVNNNIKIPVIIPILMFIRDFGLCLPNKNNILMRILNLHGTNLYIEYYLAMLSSVLIIAYYYYQNNSEKNNENKKEKTYLKIFLYSVIFIFIVLLAINAIYS